MKKPLNKTNKLNPDLPPELADLKSVINAIIDKEKSTKPGKKLKPSEKPLS